MRIVPFGAAREVTGSCPLRASVHTLGGFSGHAGQDELLSWLEGQRRVVLVHGEEEKLLELGEAPRPQGAGGEPGNLGGRGSGLKPSLSKTMRVAGLLLRV